MEKMDKKKHSYWRDSEESGNSEKENMSKGTGKRKLGQRKDSSEGFEERCKKKSKAALKPSKRWSDSESEGDNNAIPPATGM